MKIALTIGGSDPTGGAGIQADLKTFQSFGVYGLSIPAALTAQNTKGVSKIHKVPSGFFSEQIDTLLKDISPDALKTGMLGDIEIVKVVAEKIRLYSLKNLVIDPVAVSSIGVQLIESDALKYMNNHLFPLAVAITPNIYEASIFTGINIEDEVDMKKAAVKLRESGAENVIITGGHLEEKTFDLLLSNGEFLTLQRERLKGEYHGTGCIFSSAISACLALGHDIREAFVKANEFVWNTIMSAHSIGKGMKILSI